MTTIVVEGLLSEEEVGGKLNTVFSDWTPTVSRFAMLDPDLRRAY
jgi:hypothetical protein